MDRKSAQIRTKKKKALWLRTIGATLILCAAIAIFASRGDRFVRGINDFLPFYTAARLVGTEQMYSPQAAEAEQRAVAGVRIAGAYHLRLPFHALALKPLTMLPYAIAYWIWQAINLGCFVVLVRYWLFPRGYGLLTALFVPAFHSIWIGQDTLFLTLCAAGFVWLTNSRRQAAGGLLLALCAAKFHMFVFVPLALAVNRQWRAMASATLGVLVLLAASFAAGDWDWPAKYVAAIRNEAASPALNLMPNVFLIFRSIRVPPWGELIVAGFLAIAIGAGVWRARNLKSGLGLALIGGILISPHIYVYDCVLLLVALPCAAPHGRWARYAKLAALTPLPYLLFFTVEPLNLILPTLLLVIVADASLGRNATQEALSRMDPDLRV